MLFKKLVLLIFIFLIGCTDSDSISGDVNNIKLEFIEGLNDDIDFHLNKNSEGYYELVLNKFSNQTIQRITAKLTQNNFPIQDNYGNIQPKLIEWESNLYWYLGDTLGYIKTQYLNDDATYVTVNTSYIIGFNGHEVPTSNMVSYSNSYGQFNNMIAPVQSMVGDTLTLTANWNGGKRSFNIVLD